MVFTIEDSMLDELNMTQEQVRIDFAVGLYSDNKITLGQAARLARLSQLKFLKELGKREIPVHYDIEEFDKDIAYLKTQHIL
jgi:predicted HTH domain antitoxin